jgi:hypothetical protein
VRYIILDDATDPTTAVKNARKLVGEDKVDVILGSSSVPASTAIVAVATESEDAADRALADRDAAIRPGMGIPRAAADTGDDGSGGRTHEDAEREDRGLHRLQRFLG